MKIGIVSEWFERGSSYVTKIYAEQLRHQGEEVFIYARNEHLENYEEPWDGVGVTFGTRTKIPFGKALDKRDFTNWIQRHNITHIIFNEQIWVGPVLWARDLGIVTIAYVDYYTRKSLRDFIAYDLLICNTRRHLQAFSWHPNSIYMKWGTDLALFAPDEKKYDADAPVRFFHSCGWSPYRKGTDLILQALQYISDDNFELTIHTQVDLGRYLKTKHPSLVDTLSDPRIHVIHETVNAPGHYANHDVYVYPTRLEGIGLSQLEAQACGLPLIVPDNPPMNELTSEIVSQLLPVNRFFRREDDYYWDMCEVAASDIASAMESFIRSRAEIPLLRTKTREFAETQFNLERNFANLANILKDQEVSRRKQLQISMLKIKRFSYRPQFLLSPIIFMAWSKYKKVIKRVEDE